MTTPAPTFTAADFDRDYYENGIATGKSCYVDYRWLPDLTIPMAHALVTQLGIKRTDEICDFGCAKGYLVKALAMLGHPKVYGVDISEYAIANADEAVKHRCFLSTPGVRAIGGVSEWIIAKDVLEHICDDELDSILNDFRLHSENLFVAVPLGDGEKFVIPEMEKDVTHRIRRPLVWWIKALHEAGFQSVTASYTMPGIKENWTTRYPRGNGFLIAK